ncbi:MAG: alpha/beta fold hydrolase [Rhodospirillaceae bacterium]|jgi:pimeloyl-ACP methyl ester carboxylesterase|nr:alpha/beta fold hydrolase [Rhodospirillaceae bacterium]
MKRQFVSIGDTQLHVRRAGRGPPVILLHPSPQSGAFSEPMLNRLAKNFTAIAVDTPGYGLSDPLAGGYKGPALDDYLPPLVGLLDALGIEKAAFYGNATGAEVAHIFAAAHPDRVAAVMLDTAGDVSDDFVDNLVDGYFPDVTPRRDGSHLLTHWDMVRSLNLFAPWQFTTRANRLPVDMPSPEKIQEKMLDYLRTGKDYALAYKPAFYTAKHHLISRVTVPATLTRWAAKPDLTEVDDLIAKGLPDNFTVLHAGPTMDERLNASEQYLIDTYLNTGNAAPPHPDQVDRSAARLQKMFIDVGSGQLMAQGCFAGSGRPILGLHDPAGSSNRLAGFLAPYVGKRPVIALDNPSSGESDKFLSRDQINTEAYASAAWAALDALGIDEVDVVGRYSGGQVAMEMASARPGRVKHIVQAGVQLFADDEREDLLANYTPSIAPRWDGGHLITAWSVVRDMGLFWPWYNRTKGGVIQRDANIDPNFLDSRVQDLLKIGDLYQSAYAASFTYPMAEKLAALEMPCLLADYPGAASYDRLIMAQVAAPNCQIADLPENPAELPSILDPFFAS